MVDKIQLLEEEVRQLSLELDSKREQLLKLKRQGSQATELDNAAISRYSRQLILPEIGPRGQEKLLSAKVIIVGAGGLGCPCCLYLCSAGVGRIGLVDFDSVEISNIQRQVMHTEARVGMNKALSCAISGDAINSKTRFDTHHLALSSQNAMEVLKPYDVVVDCSDNVATRYLLNDACVLLAKPLVSGSALRFEGQLTVYNHAGAPCYRCLYPKPPPVETVTNCSDGGVLGAITGVIGSLQALETIKIVCSLTETLTQRMLLFDGINSTFRVIKLRPKKPNCVVCGKDPRLSELIDYEQFCGAGANDKVQNLNILKSDERITVQEYETIIQDGTKHCLIDVRMPVELEICKLACDKVNNIPFDEFSEWNMEKIRSKVDEIVSEGLPVYVVCHRGNDSQKVVRFLKEKLTYENVFDIRGGVEAWARLIDPNFPRY